jgi:hypothetical protein
MSLSRRTFTKELKEGAVRRLALGASIAGEVFRDRDGPFLEAALCYRKAF